MDDQFLYDLREDPSPEFAEKLRRKLSEQGVSAQMSRSPIWRKPAAVALAVAAVFLISLSFPAVRAVAQQFLDLFRVQRFVAVSADPERIKQIARIANEGFDVKSLLSRNVKVVKEPTRTAAGRECCGCRTADWPRRPTARDTASRSGSGADTRWRRGRLGVYG